MSTNTSPLLQGTLKDKIMTKVKKGIEIKVKLH